MSKQVSEIAKLRRRIFSNVTKLALEDNLKEKINDLPHQLIPDEGLGYRCCVHKERAIINERIESALGLEGNNKEKDLKKLAKKALDLNKISGTIVNVLEIACDRCPLDKYRVSDACRNCVDHSCMNVCPRDAIVIVQNRAYIDQEKCVECGLCKKSCSYNAIVEMNRPCETSCQVDAIKANTDRQANIDYDHCVSCGACIQGCPFGAITYRSQILQVIKMLKEKKTIAMLAPSFVGQFGTSVNPSQVKQALIKLGFSQVYEVALGADIVAIEETKELLDKVPDKQSYLTTSCCPSFLSLIKQEFPEIADKSSSTVSPMVALAKVLKEDNPRDNVVFIGPCIAKKDEALNFEVVDAVLTFEELGSMFVGAGINLPDLSESDKMEGVSNSGRTFARAGGLIKAVTGSAKKLNPNQKFETVKAEGIQECIKTLRLAKANQYQKCFIEGMGCNGGCVGGPGVLMNSKVITKKVNNFALGAEKKEAVENEEAKKKIKQLSSKEFHQK